MVVLCWDRVILCRYQHIPHFTGLCLLYLELERYCELLISHQPLLFSVMQYYRAQYSIMH